MLPSDLIGVSIYNHELRAFEFKKGPLFANIILADEINRATPRTQSSLLEAMNEQQITVDHQTYKLPDPFIVLATQNPQEFHGTYPLPESQLDRFLLRIRIGYPSSQSERYIIEQSGFHDKVEHLDAVISADDMIQIQKRIGKVYMAEEILNYLMEIVEGTRRSRFLQLGVSTCGGIFLHRVAKASAYLNGRKYCIPDDVKKLVIPTFSHRVLVKNASEEFGREREEAEKILLEIVENIPVPG
jgi:MoxR-like ATPase